MLTPDIAATYARDLATAELAGVDAEPEAQLTTPFTVLVESVAQDAGLGLRLVREPQLDGVRPDFQVVVGTRPTGWVELKAPSKSVDGRTWKGREARQWKHLADLDALLVANGHSALLFRNGEPYGDPVALPHDNAPGWVPGPLQDRLRLLTDARPQPVTSVSRFAERLAPLVRLLQERLRTGLRLKHAPVVQAKRVWAANVHEHIDDPTFADDVAQVVGYSLAIAALRGGADTDNDGLITLREAQTALRATSRTLAAALGPVLETPGLAAAVAGEVAAIERLVSVVDSARLAATTDPRGEPWLWFYEDFLAAYDPERRKASGVYYTPTDVVACQVRLVDHVLRETFGYRLGFGAPEVVTLDPACGSGTYPLAILDRAANVATAERGPAGPEQVAPHLATNLLAFELLPGPYAVAQLRIGQRLAELGPHMPRSTGTDAAPWPRVLLADTLDAPDVEQVPDVLFGDAAILAGERRAAALIKRDQPVMVVIGNPPYRRVERDGSGGWVLASTGRPDADTSLFDDILNPARRHTIFSHHASLYNLYVYFWRWALWKAFEQRPDGPAVVSFITAASWLNGPGFLGLRQLARELADDIWVVDLGGDSKGTQPEDNVFAIGTPVAIVTLVRRGATHRETAARTSYRRVRGSRAAKLDQLQHVQPPVLDPEAWSSAPDGWHEPLMPPTGDAGWQDQPALVDLFPWQQPGCKFGRAWPIAPHREVLEDRWSSLLGVADEKSRGDRFVTAKAGRNIHTAVAGLPPLVNLPRDAPPQPIVRYGYSTATTCRGCTATTHHRSRSSATATAPSTGSGPSTTPDWLPSNDRRCGRRFPTGRFSSPP